MVVGVTALDVALVGAIAAAAAVVVQPVTTLIVTLLTHRHERWVHQYNDYRDAYLELLAYAFERRVHLRRVRSAIQKGEPWPDAPTAAEEREAVAKVNAFATDEVIIALNDFQRALPEVGPAGDLEHASEAEREAAARALDQPDALMGRKLEALRRAVRRELVPKARSVTSDAANTTLTRERTRGFFGSLLRRDRTRKPR